MTTHDEVAAASESVVVDSVGKTTTTSTGDVFTRLAAFGAAAFATDSPMQDYLRSAGIADPAIWSAFRLGVGHGLPLDGLTEHDWTALAGLGLGSATRRTLRLGMPGTILMPTFHPGEPEKVVGFIRLTASWDLHRFATPPAGLACTADIINAPRVVIADVPLLGLRLANLGVGGVAVVEDPAVLPPLVEWLSTREVVIAGFRTASRAAIRAALGEVGARAIDVVMLPEIGRSPAASMRVLGIGGDEAPEPISLHVLRDIHRYSVVRLGAGDAARALRTLGIEDARFVEAFKIGFLPADFDRALSCDQRRMVKGRITGDALVVPAFDSEGVVVDLMLVPATDAPAVPSLHDEPRGLIGAAVTTAYDSVIVVDAVQDAADLSAEGHRQVVLLRGVRDAEANAARMVANGVRHAVVRSQHDAEEISAVLRAAGIEVTASGERHVIRAGSVLTFPGVSAAAASVAIEPPAAPSTPVIIPDLVLVEHNQRTEQATFTADDISYEVEVPWDERTRIAVRIKRGGHEHPDRLDLAEDAQRRRCASSAALRVNASPVVIEAHLVQLHHAVRDLADQVAAPPPSRRPASPTAMSDVERTEAMELAKQPDLLTRVLVDLGGSLGWVGEDSAKRLTFLAAISRNLDEPVWVALTASGHGERCPGLAAIAAITPPEDRVHVSKLSDGTFYYADPAGLRHKLVIIDDASAISTGVGTALRVLKRRGALSAPRVERDPVRGDVRTTFIEVHGPVAVLTATGGTVDPQLQPHVVEIAADESPEHVARVYAERHRRLAQPSDQGEVERVIKRLQNLQRVIGPRRVTIPFAEGIEGFGASARDRREHETLASLIAAHALLHQHQRQVIAGSVTATVDDFIVAATLMNERRAIDHGGIGWHAQRLLTAVSSAGIADFSMEDLNRLLPGWTRHAFRAGIDELVALDYVASSRAGRGAVRIYSMYHGRALPATAPVSCISLRSTRQLVKLAEVGDTVKTNVTAERDVG